MIDERNRFDIVIHAGADFVLTLTMRDADGTLMDLTGYTGSAQLREFPESLDHFNFSVTHNDDGGKILVKMHHSITERIGYTYGTYDVLLTDANGLKERIMYGDAQIIPAVTR